MPMSEPRVWPVVRLGSMLKATATRGRPDLPLLSVVREKGIIVRDTSSREANHNFIPDDLSNYKVVEPSHLAINKMKAWSGSLGISEHHGIVSPAYYVFETSFGVPRFAHYLLRSRTLTDEFARCSDGVRVGQWDLSIAAMKNIRVGIPSPEEQALIVRYLDNAELRIARAVQAKQELLQLLTEQQSALFDAVLLQHAASAEQVPGPSWFGSVPESWATIPLKSVVRESKARSADGSEPHYSMSQRLGLVPAALGGGVLISASYAGGRLCEPGDIVLNRLKAHLGVFAVAPTKCLVSPDYTVLRVVDESDPEFMCAMLRSRPFRPQLRISVRGLVEGFWRLFTPDLLRLTVPLPPIETQRKIMEEYGTRANSVERAVEALHTEISLLREYRTRLISDVVTGKRDVRAEACGMKDVEPAELTSVLAGATVTENDDSREDDDDE